MKIMFDDMKPLNLQNLTREEQVEQIKSYLKSKKENFSDIDIDIDIDNIDVKYIDTIEKNKGIIIS